MVESMENLEGASAAKRVAEPAESTDRDASTSSASRRRLIKAGLKTDLFCVKHLLVAKNDRIDFFP